MGERERNLDLSMTIKDTSAKGCMNVPTSRAGAKELFGGFCFQDQQFTIFRYRAAADRETTRTNRNRRLSRGRRPPPFNRRSFSAVVDRNERLAAAESAGERGLQWADGTRRAAHGISSRLREMERGVRPSNFPLFLAIPASPLLITCVRMDTIWSRKIVEFYYLKIGCTEKWVPPISLATSDLTSEAILKSCLFSQLFASTQSVSVLQFSQGNNSRYRQNPRIHLYFTKLYHGLVTNLLTDR